MDAIRTPDDRFENLPGYDFTPNYLDVAGLRMHYVDEGPGDAAPVLLVHGEPSWSYLYRKMIPLLAAAGHRVIAPDLIGFGRSDKPSEISDYTYQRHVDWMTQFVTDLDLRDITLFGQDWGSLIGLRVAAENADRFARIAIGNGALPTGDHAVSEAFMQWREFATTSPRFDIGRIIQRATVSEMSEDEVAAYDAPFPDDSYKAGARAFPALVPITPDDPASEANRRAWAALTEWRKPFLTAFSDKDPILGGGEKVFKKLVPGAAGQPHVIIEDGGHFLQEDKGEELAEVLIGFIARDT
ncbi:MAG: alpha/beta fold hydrolase [Woeseiaceae bacterium]|nr:alpha/beta fold hydrolase [Woeseiaceae bacterium]NIP21745.1 alpha/beta fold hydrolase [Woeseiaceae bacterium]NIS90830.1 alpha/beta fold hydrolase [Woeseiaceae bacterium]